jgi:hypothetical protein
MLGLSTADALERAVATQWFIDEQLLDPTRRLLLGGPKRRRDEIVLPVRPVAKALPEDASEGVAE